LNKRIIFSLAAGQHFFIVAGPIQIEPFLICFLCNFGNPVLKFLALLHHVKLLLIFFQNVLRQQSHSLALPIIEIFCPTQVEGIANGLFP
jgi:hypothetical protein